MTELIISLAIMIFGAWLVRKRFALRDKANDSMLSAMDNMFAKWNALADAKAQRDSDVPDDIMELANFMIKTANARGMPFLVVAIVFDRNPNGLGSGSRKPIKDDLRDPLDEVFSDLVHAWFTYTANRNLFARFLLRYGLGRHVEKDDHYTPYNAKLVDSVARKKGGLSCPPAAA